MIGMERFINCPACRAEMEADAVFCNECGFALTANARPDADRQTMEPPGKPCPNCGKQMKEDVRFCSGCAHDFSGHAPEQAKPGGEVVPHIVRHDDPSAFSPELVQAVKRRYRDGYMHARAINGFGALIKGVGLVVGIVLFLAGYLIGRQIGFGIGFATGAIIAVIFWVVGVLVKASAQMLTASLDGAVHSSPFLTVMERAEMMSLPTGK